MLYDIHIYKYVYIRLNNIPAACIIRRDRLGGKSRSSVTFSKVVVPRGQIISINTIRHHSFTRCYFLFRGFFFLSAGSLFALLIVQPSSYGLVIAHIYVYIITRVCVPKKIFIHELLIRNCISNPPSSRTQTRAHTIAPLSEPPTH